jgi:hypothetical protein
MPRKPSKPPEPLKSALTPSEIEDRLAVIAEENAAAEKLLQTLCNDDARWHKLRKQGLAQGIDQAQFTSLCGKMVRTRKEWSGIPLDARALAAFHGLLIALGSTPNAADDKAYAQAVAKPGGQ